MFSRLLFILMVAAAAGADTLADAKDAAVEVASEAVAEVTTGEADVAITNWTDGYVEVTAVGAANLALAQSQAHALSMAEETARALAYRKLAERIYGVRVNSRFSVESAVTTNDTLVNVTEGIVRDAHEVAVKHEVLSDGSVLCTVTLSVPMTTARGLSALAAQTPPGDGAALRYAPGGSLPEVGDYTGVIIDATGLDVGPALAPTLLTEDGRLVYGAGTLAAGRMATYGVANYAMTLEQAREKGAGDNPFVIKALKAVGEYACDLVLPTGLVDVLFSLDQKKDFLKNGGHVVIMTRGVQP